MGHDPGKHSDEQEPKGGRRGRPRWTHKRSRKRDHTPSNRDSDTQKRAAPAPEQKGQQRNARREHPYQIVNGRFIRKDRFTATININHELEKSYREAKKDIHELKQAKETCVLCSEPITDILSAIPHREKKGLCHFECVQKELSGQEEIKQNETITYIGNGDFCIVQERRNRGKPYYFFRKRIHYKDPENVKK
jgi:hypothetical protein